MIAGLCDASETPPSSLRQRPEAMNTDGAEPEQAVFIGPGLRQGDDLSYCCTRRLFRSDTASRR